MTHDLLDAAMAQTDDLTDVSIAESPGVGFADCSVPRIPGCLVAGDGGGELSLGVGHGNKCTENLTGKEGAYRFLYMATTSLPRLMPTLDPKPYQPRCKFGRPHFEVFVDDDNEITQCVECGCMSSNWDPYTFWSEIVADLAGERVRLTFKNGIQTTGVASVKDYGHCIDVRIDGHGGFSFEAVVRVEKMGENGRYA